MPVCGFFFARPRRGAVRIPRACSAHACKPSLSPPPRAPAVPEPSGCHARQATDASQSCSSTYAASPALQSSRPPPIANRRLECRMLHTADPADGAFNPIPPPQPPNHHAHAPAGSANSEQLAPIIPLRRGASETRPPPDGPPQSPASAASVRGRSWYSHPHHCPAAIWQYPNSPPPPHAPAG